MDQQPPTPPSEWVELKEALRVLADQHPVLKIRPGPKFRYDFLAKHKDTLIERDLLRLASGYRWIVRREPFVTFTFDVLTGKADQ